jgi:hypothetical protein
LEGREKRCRKAGNLEKDGENIVRKRFSISGLLKVCFEFVQTHDIEWALVDSFMDV